MVCGTWECSSAIVSYAAKSLSHLYLVGLGKYSRLSPSFSSSNESEFGSFKAVPWGSDTNLSGYYNFWSAFGIGS